MSQVSTDAEVVTISNNSSVPVGERALLTCAGSALPSIEITWMHDGQTIVNSSLVFISEEDTIQGERLFKQSSLQIGSVQLADAGSYTCVVSNGVTTATSFTRLAVTGK